MTIMKYFTKEVRIALVGIAALCVLVYGLNYLKGIHMFRPTIYFYVNYENIKGLTKSSPVYADGYKVGLVREIYYDYKKPRNVTVEIELDTEMQIPRGSYAELEVEMLGTVKMHIVLPDHNKYGIYAVGDTIPGRMSSGLMESVSSLMPKIESLIPKLDTILISVQQLVGNEDIPQILSNVKHTTAGLQSAVGSIDQLMKKDIPLLAAKLNTIGDNFAQISDNLKGIDYAETFSKVDSTLANVKMFTEKLNSRDNSIGMFLNDTQLYNNLNTVTLNAASLLEDLQSHPKRYVHFSVFGRKDK